MIPPEFESALREIALGGFRYFETTGSTNDIALEWASKGALDLSLVVADEQINGRGRSGRQWFTLSGAGLAFSLVLRPIETERRQIARFSGLAALALVNVLKNHAISAQIKWPNDVLIRRKKVAGILTETVWLGTEIESLVLGMGVNVLPGSLPPGEILNYPATSLETELLDNPGSSAGGAGLSRFQLLKDLLSELIDLRKNLASDGFLEAWQTALAFRGENVHIWQGHSHSYTAELLGLASDGSLRVRLPDGGLNIIHFGEVHLRPLVE